MISLTRILHSHSVNFVCSFWKSNSAKLESFFSLGIYVSAALTFVSRYPDLTSDCGPTGEAENGGFPFDNFVPTSGFAFDPEPFSILCEESRRNWAEFAFLFRHIRVLLRTKSTRWELWPRSPFSKANYVFIPIFCKSWSLKFFHGISICSRSLIFILYIYIWYISVLVDVITLYHSVNCFTGDLLMLHGMF